MHICQPLDIDVFCQAKTASKNILDNWRRDQNKKHYTQKSVPTLLKVCLINYEHRT